MYTDVWTSMGQEAESAERQRAFAPYQVNSKLLALAKPDAIFMHCLPAKRGEEVTDRGDGIAAIGWSSIRLKIACTRRKALLVMLLG